MSEINHRDTESTKKRYLDVMNERGLETMLPGAHLAETRARYRKDKGCMVGVKQVAKEFGVSEITVRRKVKEGMIPHIRLGSLLRFDLEECRVAFQQAAVRRMDEQAQIAEACEGRR